MRKQFLLMLILCLTASLTWAERIDVATARKVAGSVAQREGVTSGLRSASDLSLVYAAAPGQSGSALRSGVMEGSADYFVFNFPGEKGFAIVAGDDRVRPVLGYSDEGSFDPDNLPENLRGMLAYYQDQITWANDKDIEATPDIAAEWSRLMSGTALRAAGEPVLLRTANWSQGEPYNRQTPIIKGEHAVTGCVATAMGIIMKYHEYPIRAVNPPEWNYYSVDGRYQGFQLTYDDYDWANMLDTYTSTSYNDTQADAVAELLYHCGANVEMKYTLEESGTPTVLAARALSDVFGYSHSIRYLQKDDYRWEEWKEMLKNELDTGYPVIYDGQSNSGGHAFVCDGYNNDELYHINWGWGGLYNGNFVLSLLDSKGNGLGYSEGQGMLLNIRPEQTGERYYMRPSLRNAYYTKSGNSASVSFDFEYFALYDHTFYIGLGVVDQNNQIIHKPGSPIPANLQGMEDDGSYHLYNGNTRSIILSSPLLGGQRIALLCSLDGTEWEVMRGKENVPTGIDDNGVINPTPDDPNDPEQPMNVNIIWNKFDDKYMRVSGLDPSKNNYDNTKGISYQLSNVREDVILRYTITNYADWKGHLDIYYGTDYTLSNGGKGTQVTITDGSFDIPVTKAEIESEGSYYVNYLKIYSDRAGELSYKIQVFPKSATTPDFEQEGKKMTFVNDIEGSYDVNPIRGAVGQMIPFNLTFDKVDAVLQGKPLSLSIHINNVQQGQIHLYGTDGKEIELTSLNSSLGISTPNPVAVGNLQANSPYSFKLKSDVELQGAQDNVYINLYTYVDGLEVPSLNYIPYIYIDPATVKTYTVASSGLTGLKWEDGTVTSIEEGKEFRGRLVCTQAGYQIPATLQKVTMGGQVLAEGSGYGYADGWISIKKVTGDVVITAAAEPIPTVTYMIKEGQMTGATSDIPSGGKSVQENSECTIKLTAEPGYLIKKADVIIKTEDKTLQQGKDYTCTEATDYKSLTVKIHAVTADMELFVYADPEPKSFSITGKLTHLTADKDIVKGVSVKENESFGFTLKPATDYRLPEAITILDGETPLVAERDYTYDKTSGKVVIFNVTSDLVIKATAIDNHQIQVVFNLEGVIATPNEVGPFTINTKPVFEVAFAAAEGYEYNGEIEVRMGDKLLSTPADYEYVPENDHSFTLKTPLSATLTITAKGTQKSYSVTTAYTNISTPAEELPKNVLHGNALSFKITPDEGYDLPETIEVKVGDKILAAATDYTYNKATGEVSIVKVTGDVVITAVAVLKTYEVKLTLEKLTSDFKEGTKVNHGAKLDIQLTATAGYELPKSVSVKMNGKDVTAADFSYANGKISIAKVLGPIEITAKANKTYPTQAQMENLDIEGLDGPFAEGSTIKAKLYVPEVVEGEYRLPYSIRVTMDGRPLVAGVDYTYDNQTGEIEIPNVHGIVSIAAVGIEKDHFEVVLNLANLTSSPASFEPQVKDTKIELTLEPSSGYELPSGVTVKMGGATLAVDTDYAYDRSTGKFTLERITGTLVITANGSRIPEPEPEPTPTTYTVTLPVVEGATISASGSTTVTEGSSLSFTVEVKAGYNADNMVVKANGTTLTADSNGRYTIANIRSNVVVTVTGIVKGDDPTANEEIEAGELRVWASGSRLFIRTPEAERAYVVTFDGRVYKTLSLSAGEYSEQMPQGSYIIQIGKQSYKLNF